ncbi:MAG TPA: LCP family protein [Stackebrandtia sp.]|uniref:LCP family protein n=1 Tax=Stackebrandtia sp. TaxID=2023065 RepID=UPI002D66D5AB|nr:LCP family protein [Stackebrandtia sp.]HZE39779.1 LCP family protein [Stackebrandtia sp.]
MSNYGSNRSSYGGSARVPYSSGGGASGGGRVVIMVLMVISLIATVGGIGVFAYAKSLGDDLSTFDAFNGLDDRPEDDDGLNILVLGSDSRDPNSDKGSRSDTMIMVHVPSDGKHAYVVSFPRDLYVDVPPVEGTWDGGKTKINAAMAFGGVPLVVKTIENYSNARIDHVVKIDFNGLKYVVNALGGVTMNVQPADDGSGQLTSIHTYKDQKGPRTWKAGKQKLGGESALDYVRQRKQFAEGDFARVRHQQQLLMAMADKATSAGIMSSPSKIKDFVKSIGKAVKVDKDFDLTATALQFAHLRTKNMKFITCPNKGSQMINGESVVQPDEALDKSMFKAIVDQTMPDWVKKHPEALKGGASDPDKK